MYLKTRRIRKRYKAILVFAICLILISAATLGVRYWIGKERTISMLDSFQLGVNTHFQNPSDRELDMLYNGGFRIIRTDLFWSSIEKNPGQYSFQVYDALVNQVHQKGIRMVLVLDYANRLYDDGLAPHSREGRQAFCRFAEACVRRYAGKGILWEICNEPNLKAWAPEPDADAYAALALEVMNIVKKQDPSGLVAAPAASCFPWDFLERLGSLGVFKQVSAATVHPYRAEIPETVTRDYENLRRLLDQYAKDRSIPIASGEWGYPSMKGESEELNQARYLTRMALTNLMNHVNLNIWYDWKDDGTDPDNKEHHFGTVHRDLTPKPAYEAAKTLTSVLQGARFIKRIELGNKDDYILLFKKNGKPILAAWTVKEDHSISLNLPKQTADYIQMLGEHGEVRTAAHGMTLELSQSPQYLFIHGDFHKYF